jgi:hypothetical protein
LNKTIVTALVLSVSVHLHVLAQDMGNAPQSHGEGLTLSGGVSRLVLRDEYVSREKYSAVLPLFGITWTHFRSAFAYAVAFQYQSTTQLKNYNVSAQVRETSLRFDVLVPLTNGTLLGRNASVWLGPGSEIFLHDRRQDMAGDWKASSSLGSLNATVNAELFCDIGSSLQVEGVTQISLVSLTGKSSAERENHVRLLSVFSALRAEGEIHLRFCFSESLSLTAGYRFQVTRISAWDFFISGSDNGIVAITYDF